MTPTSFRRSWLPRRALLEWAVLSTVLATLAVVLGAQVGLGRADLVLYDIAQSIQSRPAPENVAIVAIDDESLAAVGRWPWRRAVLATLLDRVAAARPRAIGVDVILSELDERDPKGDAVLAGVIKGMSKVVFPVTAQSRGGPRPELLLPARPFLQAGVRLGHVLIEPDADGTVRSLYLYEGYADRPWPAFSLVVGGDALDQVVPRRSRLDPQSAPADAWQRADQVHIDFAGPPGTVKRVSALGLLTGKHDSADLAGKFVLVGATATGVGDAYPTPTTGHSELMPGVEVQAQALNALLLGRIGAFASATANALFTFAPVAIALIGFVILAPRLVLPLVASLIAATLAGSALILAHAQMWYPPAAAVLLLLVAYPVWSWRRLDAVVRFLGSQFEQLEHEPAVVPSAPEPSQPRFSDVLGRQIGAVRRAADRLREARRFVADSLDGLPIATLVAGAKEEVLIANRLAEELFSAPHRDELRGRALGSMLQQLSPERPSLWDEVRRGLRDKGRTEIEFIDAKGRSLLLGAAPSVDSDGEPVGLLVTLVDLTAIREAQRRRDETLAFLSHDIRSPQASILAAIELHGLDPQQFTAAETLARIKDYARSTVELSEQFVQLSRVETQEYKLVPCDLSEIAREAVDAVAAQATAKSIGMEIVDAGAVVVHAERQLLLRAIVNLTNNAIKYSPPDSRVSISVSANDTEARCAVRDQGYGISEKDQKRLFQRFARFSSAGQPKEKGIGLGLAFVKTVVERHGGRMTVTSAPGAGSEFGFELPLAPAT